QRAPADAAHPGAARGDRTRGLRSRDVLFDLSGARAPAAVGAGAALRTLGLRDGPGAGAPLRAISRGPAGLAIHGARAGASRRARGRRGRAAEVIVAAAGDALRL